MLHEVNSHDYGTLAFAFARPLPLVFDFAWQGVMTTQRWHNKHATCTSTNIINIHDVCSKSSNIIDCSIHPKANHSTESWFFFASDSSADAHVTHALARPFGFGFLSIAALLFSNLRNLRANECKHHWQQATVWLVLPNQAGRHKGVCNPPNPSTDLPHRNLKGTATCSKAETVEQTLPDNAWHAGGCTMWFCYVPSVFPWNQDTSCSLLRTCTPSLPRRTPPVGRWWWWFNCN